MAHALEISERDLIFAARVRLALSAGLVVGGGIAVAVEPRWRFYAVIGMGLSCVNTLIALRTLRLVHCRLLAAMALSEALRGQDDAAVERAWMTLMYLSDPATGEQDVNRPARHKQSAFRHLRRDTALRRAVWFDH
jgi:hypothetical protein